MASSSARVFGRRCSVLMAASKTPAASVAGTKASRRRGVSKPASLPPAFSEFLGVSVVRHSDEVDEKIRKIWKTIKLEYHQNPRNKKEIVCDERLKKLFRGKDTIGYLDFSQVLKPHFMKSKRRSD